MWYNHLEFGDIMRCLVDYKIINNKENLNFNDIEASFKNNILSFKDENDSIKITIKKDNIIMDKESIASKITFNFIKNTRNEVKYYIKMFNSYLNTEILTNELKIDDKRIYIEYELWVEDEYMGIFKYELMVKEV